MKIAYDMQLMLMASGRHGSHGQRAQLHVVVVSVFVRDSVTILHPQDMARIARDWTEKQDNVLTIPAQYVSTYNRVLTIEWFAKTRETHFSILHFITLYCPQILCIFLCVTICFTGFCERLCAREIECK